MKKIIAFLLAAALCCSLFGCVGKMTAVEHFVIATKKMDFASMKNELVPDESIGSLYRKLQNTSDIGEDSLRVLRDLYSMITYTVGESSESENGIKTVQITMKIPDMERIRSHVQTKILVSADSAETIVGNMIADGSIAKGWMSEHTFSVELKETDGVFKIDYDSKANAQWKEALAIEKMIDLFIIY